MAGARSSGAAAGQLGSLYSLGAAGNLTDGQLLERFLTRDDPAASEAAFTALVNRHGTMVLSVCRRELADPHDASDAFQATFLVLMRKAATIRRRESVGGWLFGIARRVAARARVDGARRRRHLQQFGASRPIFEEGPVEPAAAEADLDYAPLIAEVDRLPERFRAPVVLHYFEGLSAEATAQRLGCARGTVLSRLSRARNRIKQRLEQQGVGYPALIAVGGPMIRWLPPTPVPAWLAHATVRAVSSMGLAGAAIESLVPAAVASLSRRVARTLVLSRVGMAAALLVIAAAGFSIGLAASLRPDEPPQSGAAMEKPRGVADKARSPRGAPEVKGEPVVVRVQVVDPEGKPASGAEILLHLPTMSRDGEGGPRRVGAAGVGGRFELSIPRTPIEPQRVRTVTPTAIGVVTATAPGFGPDWAAIDPTMSGGAITLKLRRDDVPIEGRIVNLEGRPIPGLSVSLETLNEFSSALLNELRQNGGQIGAPHWHEVEFGYSPGKDSPMPRAHTDSEGRFRLAGLGRDRAALLRIAGGSIERSFALVQTSGDREFKPIALQASFCGARRIEGPRFELAVAPGRVIEGTVRDADTGRPIAGARVNDWQGQLLTTDAQGRFRFEGQPRGGYDELSAFVEGQPYVERFKSFKDAGEVQHVQVDITLKRGSWVEGRVVNRTGGQPVPALLSYYPRNDNPHVKDYPDALFLKAAAPHLPEFPTDADGRFRAAVPPGGGLLAVKSGEPGYRAARPLDPKEAGTILNPLGFPSDMSTYHAYVPIDVPADKNLMIPEIVLQPGRTQHLRVTDAEGRGVTETWVYCLQGGWSQGEALAGDELAFHHDHPGKAETVMIVQKGRSLGAAIDLKGDEPDPMQLVLQPTGTVTGRLVDEDGKPRPGVNLAVYHHVRFRGGPMMAERFEPMITGPDGRFRIKTIVPGIHYTVQVLNKKEANASLRAEGNVHGAEWTVKPGEVQDWGNVRVEAYQP